MSVFPYPDHRSMEQVLADEAQRCTCELVEIEGDAPDCAFKAEYDAEVAQ